MKSFCQDTEQQEKEGIRYIVGRLQEEVLRERKEKENKKTPHRWEERQGVRVSLGFTWVAFGVGWVVVEFQTLSLTPKS